MKQSAGAIYTEHTELGSLMRSKDTMAACDYIRNHVRRTKERVRKIGSEGKDATERCSLPFFKTKFMMLWGKSQVHMGEQEKSGRADSSLSERRKH